MTVSHAVAADFSAHSAAYRAKLLTIHNALPPTVEANLDRLQAQPSTRRAIRRQVIATGRLAPEKNYPVLIEAIARLPGTQLSIVGAGAEEAALRALVNRLGLSDRVRFHGQQDRQKTFDCSHKRMSLPNPAFRGA